MQTSDTKMKSIALVLALVLAYSNAQDCTDPKCTDEQTCGWICKDGSQKKITNAVVTGCADSTSTCEDGNGVSGTCEAACTPKSGRSGRNTDENGEGENGEGGEGEGGEGERGVGEGGEDEGGEDEGGDGGNLNGSSKMELLTPLLVLGILARLCFYL